MKHNKLFIVVNQDWFFISHRLPIGIAAKEAGYDVSIVSEDTGVSWKIRDSGLQSINMPINKAGINIKDELKTFIFLYNLFRKEKPDVVHLVGLKTMIWGSLACRLSGVKSMISAVCGLGVMFDEQHAESLISKMILKVLKRTHKGNNIRIIFQNNDDKQLFIDNGIISEDRCVFTNGSGIDLADYTYSEEPDDEFIRVIFTARMVEDKGILVLIEAAQKLKKDYRDKVKFLLCGGVDTNPNGISRERLESLCDGEYIQWLGHREDILALLKGSHIMAFPSWYREGLPKSVIEAEAVGRPVVTTDSVGCKDTVIDGYNGFKIQPKDSDALAMAIKKLIDNPSLRKEMGLHARDYAVQKFSIEDVIKVHLNIYNELSRAK